MTTPSLLQSLVAIASALAVNAARRAATVLIGYLAALLLLAASLVFLTMSAYHAISNSLGDVYAALIVGAAYFVASLIVFLLLSFRRS
jgi:hypothetical protein